MRRWTSITSDRTGSKGSATAKRRASILVGFHLILLSLAGGCDRSDVRLDGVERMAYAVKPAVVRVNALATAEFWYPASAVETIAKELGAKPVNLPTAGARQASLKTGSGGSGSGFIVHSSGTIITSAHVVTATRDRKAVEQDLRENGSIAALLLHLPVEVLRDLHRRGELDRIVAYLAEKGSLQDSEVTNEIELSNGERHQFTIRSYSPPLHQKGSDIAILQIKREDLPTLTLGDSTAVQVGQPVWAIGYPSVASSTDDVIGGWLSQDSDLEATINPGMITSIKRNSAKTTVFQSNIAIYHGNSGGPVVAEDGRVVAISTWGHTSAEQIRFLVPVNVAADLLAKAGVRANEPGSFDRSYRSALEEAGRGNWSVARRELGSASVFFQGSPDLLRFMSDAERAIDSRPQWFNPLLVVAAALVIFPLILVIFIRGRRRRRRSAAYPMREGPVLVSPAPRGGDGGLTEAIPIGSGGDSIIGKFTILNGERAGEKLGLGGSGIRIGRESSLCEIVLENPKVSRLHAEIVALDGNVLLIDRNSSNGTYVNDRKIERQVLRDGDIIYFGGRNAVAVAFHA